MTYMIKISQTGEPKLVKVPEKPNPDLEKYVGDSMLWDEDWEEYKQALASALADEDKHFKFKDPQHVHHTMWELVDDYRRPLQGKSFPLPTGWRVELRTDHPHEECRLECICTYEDDYYAILLPEQPEEKKEPDFEKEVEKAAELIDNFRKGYLCCIENLHEWNGGMDNPCHLDLYNRLITLERKINERASELLK